jgi:hypothetical protein
MKRMRHLHQKIDDLAKSKKHSQDCVLEKVDALLGHFKIDHVPNSPMSSRSPTASRWTSPTLGLPPPRGLEGRMYLTPPDQASKKLTWAIDDGMVTPRSCEDMSPAASCALSFVQEEVTPERSLSKSTTTDFSKKAPTSYAISDICMNPEVLSEAVDLSRGLSQSRTSQEKSRDDHFYDRHDGMERVLTFQPVVTGGETNRDPNSQPMEEKASSARRMDQPRTSLEFVPAAISMKDEPYIEAFTYYPEPPDTLLTRESPAKKSFSKSSRRGASEPPAMKAEKSDKKARSPDKWSPWGGI